MSVKNCKQVINLLNIEEVDFTNKNQKIKR